MICTNCLNRYYSDVSEEAQHDPNVPDLEKPWCPRCKAHNPTELVESGEYGALVHQCITCGWTASIITGPSRFAKKRYFVLISLLIVGAWSVFGLIVKTDEFIVFPIVGLMFSPLVFIVYFTQLYYPERVRRKWLAWARERGYTED